MAVCGYSVPVEVENVMVDLGPRSRTCKYAVTFRVSSLAWMLVMMDEVVVDQDLLKIRNPMVGTEIIVHRNACATPAGNLHVGNFNIDAPYNMDAHLVGCLKCEVRAVEPKSGDADAIAPVDF